MHQHQFDAMLDRHQRQDRHGWKKIGRLVGSAVGFVLLCVLILSGCSSSDSGVAVAQQVGILQNKRIETFLITVDSFVLKTDNPPSVEARDSATVYLMQSDGDVTFQALDGSGINISLEANDLVIERPDVGTVTVMRDQ